MNDKQYKNFVAWADQVEVRLNAIEANSRKASSDTDDGLLDEALYDLKERRTFCLQMEAMCYRAREPDIAQNWAIKAEECRKSIKVVSKLAKSSAVAKNNTAQ